MCVCFFSHCHRIVYDRMLFQINWYAKLFENYFTISWHNMRMHPRSAESCSVERKKLVRDCWNIKSWICCFSDAFVQNYRTFFGLNWLKWFWLWFGFFSIFFFLFTNLTCQNQYTHAKLYPKHMEKKKNQKEKAKYVTLAFRSQANNNFTNPSADVNLFRFKIICLFKWLCNWLICMPFEMVRL